MVLFQCSLAQLSLDRRLSDKINTNQHLFVSCPWVWGAQAGCTILPRASPRFSPSIQLRHISPFLLVPLLGRSIYPSPCCGVPGWLTCIQRPALLSDFPLGFASVSEVGLFISSLWGCCQLAVGLDWRAQLLPSSPLNRILSLHVQETTSYPSCTSVGW